MIPLGLMKTEDPAMHDSEKSSKGPWNFHISGTLTQAHDLRDPSHWKADLMVDLQTDREDREWRQLL